MTGKGTHEEMDNSRKHINAALDLAKTLSYFQRLACYPGAGSRQQTALLGLQRNQEITYANRFPAAPHTQWGWRAVW